MHYGRIPLVAAANRPIAAVEPRNARRKPLRWLMQFLQSGVLSTGPLHSNGWRGVSRRVSRPFIEIMEQTKLRNELRQSAPSCCRFGSD